MMNIKGNYAIISNRELNSLFNELNIAGIFKSQVNDMDRSDVRRVENRIIQNSRSGGHVMYDLGARGIGNGGRITSKKI